MTDEFKIRIGTHSGVAGDPEELLRFIQETPMPANVWTRHTLWERLTSISLEDNSYLPVMLREMEDLSDQAARMNFPVEESFFVYYVL